jgi:hypothetical protein
MKRSAASTVPLALVLIAVATTAAAADMTGASNYLVYVEPHPPGVDCQAYQLGILAAALGGYVRDACAMHRSIDDIVLNA